jgi:hypothetical protein
MSAFTELIPALTSFGWATATGDPTVATVTQTQTSTQPTPTGR